MDPLIDADFGWSYSGDDKHVIIDIARHPRYKNPYTIEEGKQIKQRILQNEKLRQFIVDLADIWDGKESLHYGKTLYHYLKELGINDVPAFYKKENIDKFIAEMKARRHD